jgi:hypothetical protein
MQTSFAPPPGVSYDCCAMCGPLMDIKPVVNVPGYGKMINPLFDVVKRFTIACDPFPLTLGAGDAGETSLTVQAEENHYGDFLINEIMISSDPVGALFAVEIKSRQNDRVFMNAPVLDRFVGSNSQICNSIPCCFFIQATNFAQITVRNLSGAPADFRLAARGRRLLPYQYPHLREQILAYWNEQRTIPYWLTIDRTFAPGVPLDGGGVTVPAGARTIVNMTVPGGGDFEAKSLLTHVVGGTPTDILIDIKEGVGRSLMNIPLPMGDFVAQPNATVAGLQGGDYRAASGGNCKQYTQFFKRNTRLRIELENTSGAPIDVYLAWKGCAHFYGECPPGRDLERLRSLEPTIGPQLIQAPRCPPIHTFQQQQGPPPQRAIPAAGFTMPQAQQRGGVPNTQVFTGGGIPTTLEQFRQSAAGAYVNKTYNEENLRAHGYLNGGQIEFPDGGRR